MKFASALLSAALMAGSAMATPKNCDGKPCTTTTSSAAPTSTSAAPAATYTPTPVDTTNVFAWERLDKNNSVCLPLPLKPLLG